MGCGGKRSEPSLWISAKPGLSGTESQSAVAAVHPPSAATEDGHSAGALHMEVPARCARWSGKIWQRLDVSGQRVTVRQEYYTEWESQSDAF